MRLLTISCFALLLGLVTAARGDDEAGCDDPSISQATDCPTAQACKGRCPLACDDEPECADFAECAGVSDCLEERIEHAVEAAEHLEAAGLGALAVDVRRQANDWRGDLLQQKLAELDELQSEIAALRQATGKIQQVQVKVQILELSLTKMRELGFDLPFLSGKCGQVTSTSTCAKGACEAACPKTACEAQCPQSMFDALLSAHDQCPSVACDASVACDDCPAMRTAPVPHVCSSTSLSTLLKALGREKVVKVLAEPTLVTVDGRPASCAIGAEVPAPSVCSGAVAVEYRNIGVQVDLLARLLGGNKVRLEIHPSSRDLDNSTRCQVNHVSVPSIRVHELDTCLEMDLGQTAVLGGAVQERKHYEIDQETREVANERDQIQTIFLVTPELVTVEPPCEQSCPTARAPRPQPR